MRSINRFFLLSCFLLFSAAGAYAQLSANAGPDRSICPGQTVIIGGTPVAAFGGMAPYTYFWSPSAGLDNVSIPNPTASPTTTTTYILTVTDDTGAVAYDDVIITASILNQISAGNDTSICEQSFAMIGEPMNTAGGGVSYSWFPGTFLSDSTAPRPISSPTSSITYILTATVAGCPPKTDNVTVSVIPTPVIDAGIDTTIQEGETVTLHATGAYFYAWGPLGTLTYFYTSSPDAQPIVTTTYYLYGEDGSGTCPAYDSVTVFVESSSVVVIYNTFTPNADGENDTWYIGNIQKFPENKLEIYNRNGKLVYKKSSYLNDWDGKAFGQDLPASTYFYELNLGPGFDVLHGTVTIVR
ncbi:MAG: gliding motility-associated C-terminal domain-containing protein [Bacteroidota bacterium]|nr:gliding motility-associated C-terminal domain-containing protein [Bacteroidota bacterium]